MELLFETRPEIVRVDGQLYFFQCKPEVHPEPVLIGDSPIDASGVSLYGTVLHDGGRYRMWYQAWPENFDFLTDFDIASVAYAESDDGIHWHKPILKQVEHNGSNRNNLVNLAVHNPSVFIDPTAPSSHRYRATGVIDSRYVGHYPIPRPPMDGSYFTFHSSDGIHWEVDSTEPRWSWADNIFSIWHPGRRRGEVMMKRMPYVGGMARRSWLQATLQDGEYSDWKLALVPDDYDDIIARQSGHLSADYYGIAMMPAALGLVGFVVQFRHRHPLYPCKLHGGVIGNWGETDITLVYQSEPGACWLHPSGRSDFLTHGSVPWSRNGWYVGSNVIDCGQEQRLYLTGNVGGHMVQRPDEKAAGSIGFARWPKWRLFEFRAEPKGELEIDLGILKEPVELRLNYKAQRGGSVRAQILTAEPLYTLKPVTDRTVADSIPLVGDELGVVVSWKQGSLLHPVANRHTVLRLFIEHASVFAYETCAPGTRT